MKKLFLYIFLGLFFCNVVSGYELKKINVSIGCYHSGVYLNHLDRNKKKLTTGYVSNTNSLDGESKPEFNLMITLKETDAGIWDGEIIFLNHNGKKLFKLKSLDTVGVGPFGINAVYASDSGNYLESLHISQWKTSETKEIYYRVYYARLDNLKDAFSKKKKKIELFGRGEGFKNYTRSLTCFK